ncbi:hypothetical protein P0Y35_10335 [Kiritimatiellaeota bacterium B1221]|nr:hypothetical protein [Kiritimatiellaeota bacterium B1221]
MKSSILLLCVLFLQTLYGQTPQTWRSKNGHSFQGTFIQLQNQQVTLHGSDGRVVTVPIDALDTESQVQARRTQSALTKDAPVFTHQNRHLRFSLYPDRTWLTLEFLAGPQVVINEKYNLNIRFAEIRDGNNWRDMKVKEVYGKIEKTRNEVIFRLLMENDVVLKYTVDLDDKDELTYEFEAEIIPDGLPKLDFRSELSFPKLLSYNPDSQLYLGALSSEGVKFDHLKSFLDGYEIWVTDPEGKRSKIQYHEKQTQEYRGKAFTIKNPRKKSLKIEAPKSAAGGSMYIWFYDGKAPFEGFNILAHSPERNNLGGGPFSIGLK